MKILLASTSSGSRGGGELYLSYLGRALVDRGHEVILWASSHPRMDELAASFSAIGKVIREPYINTYDRRLRSLGAYFDGTTSARIARSWEGIGADVIHLNKQNLEDGLDLLHALGRVATPSLATIHLTQSARYLRAVFSPARDAISRRALLGFDGLLVTVLENRQHDLASFLGESPRIRMIANGVPLPDLSTRRDIRDATRRELGIADDQLLIVAVGRLVPQKRPLAFLDHASRIRSAQPHSRFLWVGDGTLANEWDRRVRELGIEAIVQRIGWQSDVTPFLHAADLFLHVAEFEGLPLAILEAMSAGLPCAISDHLLREMPFFDSSSAITATDDGSWISILSDRGRLQAIGATARVLAEREFSFTIMAERYDALYRETLARKR